MFHFINRFFIKSYKDSKRQPISERYWKLLYIYIGMNLFAAYFAHFFPNIVQEFSFFNKIVSLSRHMDFFNESNVDFYLEIRFAWFVDFITSPIFCYLVYKNGLPEGARKKMVENIEKSNLFYRTVIPLIAVLIPIAFFYEVWGNEHMIYLITWNMNLTVVIYSSFWMACFSLIPLSKEYLIYKP